MTAKRRLVPASEVEEMHALLKRLGVQLGGPVDIRADGVTFYPPANNPGTEYDRYRAKKDANRDAPSPR